MLITAPSVLTALPDSEPAAAGYVLIEDGVITRVGHGRAPGPPDVALPTGLLVPGFVDLQVNGYYGVEFQEADSDRWAAVARRLPETGTTAFLPTMITAPVAELAGALAGAASFVPQLTDGARVLGVHLEGPFLSAARRGAHNPAWAGLVRLVTLAPELPGALAAIRQLTAAGVVVSIGHSDALGSQVEAAATAGARMVTHLFNAQRQLGHREPGVVGQALTDSRLTSGLIVDLHHVTGPACQIALAAAPGRIALVTDAAACAGMPPGEYLLGGEPITLPAGDGAPPVRANGTLAGSALRMDRAIANVVSLGLPVSAAIAAATRIPADLIGRPDLGRLATGAAADLVWLGDDLSVLATWTGGRLAYSNAAAGALTVVPA
jgi:N-acetylglucosamine-6-phosphate deacetylase